MTSNTKILIPIAVAVVLVGAFAYTKYGTAPSLEEITKDSQTSTSPLSTTPTNSTAPVNSAAKVPVTGNVDDVLNAMVLEASDEQVASTSDDDSSIFNDSLTEYNLNTYEGQY